MIKIIFILFIVYTAAFGEIVIGKPFEVFAIEDQFGKIHHVTSQTKKIIFAFQKNTGHIVKDILKKKPQDFLEKNHTLFVADVTSMPKIIQYFLLPLKGYNFPIVTLNDKELSKRYCKENYKDKIVIVTLKNLMVMILKANLLMFIAILSLMPIVAITKATL